MDFSVVDDVRFGRAIQDMVQMFEEKQTDFVKEKGNVVQKHGN